MRIYKVINALILYSLLGLLALVHAESLYKESSYRPLTGDSKAHRVGDLLTVQVLENSIATSSSDIATRRKNNVNAEVSHGLGKSGQFGLTANGDFDGGGSTQRTNKFLTILTVSVVAVLPNGDLMVAGEQLLNLNDEQQKVNLEGRVRPNDITDGNVVISSRLADARITYLGEGEITDRQKRSWWRKIVDWMGL